MVSRSDILTSHYHHIPVDTYAYHDIWAENLIKFIFLVPLVPKPLLDDMLEAARMDLSPITSSAEWLVFGFHRSLASIQQEQGCSRLLFSWLWLVRSYPSWTLIGLILSIVDSHWIILFPEQSRLSRGFEGLLGHIYLFCSLLCHFPSTGNIFQAAWSLTIDLGKNPALYSFYY